MSEHVAGPKFTELADRPRGSGRFVIAAFCLALLTVGCATKRPLTTPSPPMPPPMARSAASPLPQSGPSDVVLGATNRILVYQAELSITVLDVEGALAAVQKATNLLGGFLHALADTSIEVRVPAARFEEAIGLLGELGAVTSRRISAEDITEEMFDLDIRLETALEMRKRLLAILERCETVEDTLAVEKELGRVTTEIEQVEGRIRFLQERVDFSSIRVNFNPAVPAERMQRLVPFPWVRELATQLEGSRTAPGRVKGRPPVELPTGFVRYRQSRDLMEAISADNVILAFRVHENLDNADLAYWQQVAVSFLTEVRHIVIDQVDPGTAANGARSVILRGRRGGGDTAVAYALALVVTEPRLYVAELFGDATAMAEHPEVLETLVSSLRAR